jgi:hypothetical protein
MSLFNSQSLLELFFLGSLVFFNCKVYEVEGSLADVEAEIEGQVHAVDNLFAIDEEIRCDHGNVSNQIDDPRPHALLIKSFLHPDIVRLDLL